jgi:hypothetical protein
MSTRIFNDKILGPKTTGSLLYIHPLNRRNDQGGRPSEHDDAVGGLETA